MQTSRIPPKTGIKDRVTSHQARPFEYQGTPLNTTESKLVHSKEAHRNPGQYYGTSGISLCVYQASSTATKLDVPINTHTLTSVVQQGLSRGTRDLEAYKMN